MTQPPPTPRRTHPLWRGFLCLLLGCGAWWLVTWWLEPRPLWVRPAQPEHVQVHPLAEDASGKYVVGYWLHSKSAQEYVDGLVVLDQANGMEVQKLSTNKPVISRSESPRFRGETLWRVGNVDDGIALFRWDFIHNKKEEVVKHWPSTLWQGALHEWSADGSTAVIKVHFSLNPYMALLDWSGWLRPVLLSDNRILDLLWYETWRLPEKRNTSAVMICRWTPHFSRWEEPLRLSGDGRWAAFRECTIDDKVLELLRKTKVQWNGDELTELVRRSPAGALVYDTETGKQVHQFPAHKALHLWGTWYGSIFLLEQFKPKAVYDQEEDFPGFDHPHNEAYDFASGKPVRVQLPFPLEKSVIVTKEINGLLLVSIPEATSQGRLHHYMTLQREGNSLVIRDCWPSYHANSGIDTLWVSPRCREAWVEQDSDPRLLHSLLERLPQWEWLNRWVGRNYESQAHAAMIPSGHNQPSLVRPRLLVQSDMLRHHLYLLVHHWHDGGSTYGNLESYRLPVLVYSSWWSRGMGLVVLLVAWVALTRRARRQKSLLATAD
jgi:hypothetical protein